MMKIVEFEEFTFSYPLQEENVLSQVNLSVEEGSLTLLCGVSGCGKSTLLRHLKTALTPHGKRQGHIRYRGQEIETWNQRQQSSEIGFVFQNPDNQIVTDKVWHEMAFGLESLGMNQESIRLRVAEMASYFGMENWFERDVKELSGGQKQLLNLASVMALHPRLLILDEPTSQVDPIAASEFMDTVYKINRDMGITVLMTEHRLDQVFSLADYVWVMDKGAILAHGYSTELGDTLRKKNHEMFDALPVPLQIGASLAPDQPAPLTIREGRQWMKKQKMPCWEKPVKQELTEEVVLSAKDVWFRYAKNESDVVKDFTFEVKRGEVIALLGGNGAGKTTALKLLSGLENPTRGSVWIHGKRLGKYTDEQLYHGLLGIMPQNPQDIFSRKSVEAELEEMVDSRSKIEKILKFTHMTHLRQRHPYDLSGGEQQRLALAKILLLEPQILMLDEPTKGLDSHFKKELKSMLTELASKGMTIILVSHDIEFCAQTAQRTGLFFQGNLVTLQDSREFFAGNHFYTTMTNRMVRDVLPDAITIQDVKEAYHMK